MDLLTLLVVIPSVATLASFLFPASQVKAIKGVGMLAGAACLGIAVHLFLMAFGEGGAEAVAALGVDRYEWVPSMGVTWSTAADGMSIAMILLTGIVYFTGALVSSQGIKTAGKEFFILLNALVAGVFGVFVVRDMFFMYFAFELAVVPMYLLIGVWGSKQKEYAAMKLTLFLTGGALVALLGILGLYFQTHETLGIWSFHLDDVLRAKEMGGFSEDFQILNFALLFVGFAAIVPMWPLHSWSPIGHAAAPSAGSMMHAGVLMKLGAFAILRVAFPACPIGAAYWLPYVAVIAMMNIIYGGLVAMAQKDMKFVIGYSSSSHMGYTLLGIASVTVIGVSGAVFLMFAHGVMTALAFSLIGWFYDQTHNRWIPDLGGLAHQIPFAGTCFVLMAMASAGVPGFANFASEFMILFGAWEAGYVWQAVVATFGIVISAVYLLRAVRDAFFGPRKERWDGLKDARTPFERAPFVVLIAVLLAFGFYPKMLTDVVEPSVAPIVLEVQEAAAELEARDAASEAEEETGAVPAEEGR